MDDRAVSEILGFLLAVAIIIATLALIQTALVPQWDANVEADHASDLRADMTGFHGAVVSTASDGGEQAPSVRLGTRYPYSGLLLRPPPSAGSLSTADGTVEIENAAAPENPETDAFLDGERRYETKLLTYRPNYTEFGERTTRYEHATLAEDHGATLFQAGGVVDGETIRLVTLTGEFDRSSTSRVSLPVAAESVSTRTTVVTGRETPDGPEDITLRLTSRIPAEAWNDRLPAHAEAVQAADDAVEIRLEGDRRYRLRLAAVRLGDDPSTPEAAYATVRGERAVGVDEPTVIEARDEYTNPAPHATIRLDRPGEEPEFRQTDADGRLRVSASSPTTITASIPDRETGSTQVFVGPEAPDLDPPTLDSGSASIETCTFRPRSEELSQIGTTYGVTDEDSGVARVGIRLLASDGTTVTSATHTYDGESSVSGQWKTPWLSGRLSGHTVELRFVDAAGNVDTEEITNIRRTACETVTASEPEPEEPP